MAHIHRLMRILALFVLVGSAGSAFAITDWASSGGKPGTYSSPTSLCNAWADNAQTYYDSVDPGHYSFYCKGVSDITVENGKYKSVVNIGDNKEPSYSTGGAAFAPIVCVAPKVAQTTMQSDGTACAVGSGDGSGGTGNQPPKVCDWAKGQTQLAFGTFFIERGKPLCSSGCSFSLKSDSGHATESKRASGTSPWFDMRTMGDFVGTGAECGGDAGASTGDPVPKVDPPPKVELPPEKCPVGKVPGQVNGVTICVPPGETTSNGGKTTETTNPAGDKQADTVDKQTTCTPTTCTTTTTTTTTITNSSGGSGGSTTKTTSETVGRGDYCKANAKEVACGGSGSSTGGAGDSAFGGSCSTGPTCEGDAVQCAQAEWAFKSACALTTAPKPEDIADYTAAAARATGDQTGDLPGSTTTAIGSGSFDQTELLGSATGMSDLTVNIAGSSITLPLSQVNSWLVMLGWILKGVTFILCIRIVTRG